MVAFSRGFSPLTQHSKSFIMRTQCRLTFATSSQLYSGHNKWSKIKHQKGAADAKRNALFNSFTKNLTLFSKLYGADVNNNPQLAATVAAAKKAGVPKATMEGAIARGQGRSTEGAKLESMTFEVIVPPSVALIVDIETDNKLRVLQELNVLVKRAKGNSTATKFFFSRLGRVVLEKSEIVTIDDIMDDAIEAGAEDLENDEEGNVIVWTQPTQTTQIAEVVGSKFGLKVLDAGIIWSPNEDAKAKVGTPYELQKLTDLVVALQEYPDVQAVYSNASRGDADEEAWHMLEENLDV